MLRLTREVRFAIPPDGLPSAPPCDNPHAGCPSLDGLGQHFALQATVSGPLDPRSNYLINIKRIDEQVRELAVPLIESAVRTRTFGQGGQLLLALAADLCGAWPGIHLHALRLVLSPFLAVSVRTTESPMVRLSERFEFCASHRLHNPALSEEENRRLFGKCSNPHGHGHNYELEVVVRGQSDPDGVLIEIPLLERLVAQTVIERFDHKNLNVEVPEFADTIPSVENIARVIYHLLKPALAASRAQLASVTVWETPKTWAEYTEDA